ETALGESPPRSHLERPRPCRTGASAGPASLKLVPGRVHRQGGPVGDGQGAGATPPRDDDNLPRREEVHRKEDRTWIAEECWARWAPRPRPGSPWPEARALHRRAGLASAATTMSCTRSAQTPAPSVCTSAKTGSTTATAKSARARRSTPRRCTSVS